MATSDSAPGLESVPVRVSLGQLKPVTLTPRGTKPATNSTAGFATQRSRETAIYQSPLTATEKLILLAACHLTGWQERQRLPSAAKLAEACSLHRVTVQNVIMGMRQQGVLAPGRELAVSWQALGPKEAADGPAAH